MSRLSRTASAIRLAAARAVAGAPMTELTSTPDARTAPSRREAASWRPCANSNADFSNLDAQYGFDGANKQHENKQQGERELLLA